MKARVAELRTTDELALSLVAVLLLDPLSVLGAGFWLGFLGVPWLLWCLPHSARRPLHGVVSAQGVATLGLLPLSEVLFGQAPLPGRWRFCCGFRCCGPTADRRPPTADRRRRTRPHWW